MKCLILLSFLLIGCAAPKYKIGQVVSNGYCEGIITSYYNDFGPYKYQVHALNCGKYTMERATFLEEEIEE